MSLKTIKCIIKAEPRLKLKLVKKQTGYIMFCLNNVRF